RDGHVTGVQTCALPIFARREGTHGRPIEDGEIQTACQAACPVGAIVFGDLNLHAGRPPTTVRQMQDHDLNYSLLTDLNTRPRTRSEERRVGKGCRTL